MACVNSSTELVTILRKKKENPIRNITSLTPISIPTEISHIPLGLGTRNLDQGSLSEIILIFSDKAEHPSVTQSQSSEWTEINLDNSSPEEDIPYKKLEPGIEKPRLSRQKTLPNPKLDNEFSSIKTKMKLDTSISNWISRSSAKNDEALVNGSKYIF